MYVYIYNIYIYDIYVYRYIYTTFIATSKNHSVVNTIYIYMPVCDMAAMDGQWRSLRIVSVRTVMMGASDCPQIVHHTLCFNLFILHNNSFDNQGSETNKNDIFYVSTYIYIYICIFIYIYIFIIYIYHIYIYMYVCMYVYMYVCLYVCMYVCMYVCIYLFLLNITIYKFNDETCKLLLYFDFFTNLQRTFNETKSVKTIYN